MCVTRTAAEYSANALQEVEPSASVVFTESPVPGRNGLIYHRDDSGLFRLASPALITGGNAVSGLYRCCCGMPEALYQAAVSANISVPEGGTVEEISLAFAIDGEIDPSSTMVFTPAAVNVGGNVSTTIIIAVPWMCRCSSVALRNTSAQAVQVENANLIFTFVGVR